jgi:hypothetical protein
VQALELKQQPAKAAGRAVPILATAMVAGALAVRLLAAPVSDDIAANEVAQRREALRLEQPIKLAAIPATADALDGIALPPEQRAALQAAVADKRLRLAWLSLYDSDAVDGDRVTVQSLGLSHTLTLGRAPVAVPVAIPDDGQVVLKGVDQGLGGGVTVGIIANGHPLKLPPLAVGEVLSLHVAAP